jgi:hypothetical protein
MSQLCLVVALAVVWNALPELTKETRFEGAESFI